MRLTIIIYLFATSFLFGQAIDQKLENSHLSQPLVEQFEFERHIYGLVYDSLSDVIILQLRDVVGKNERYKNTGELAVLDRATLNRKWSRPFNYASESLISGNGYLIVVSDGETSSLNIQTGAVMWESETEIKLLNNDFKVGLGYNNRKHNELEAIYLPFGNRLWSRSIPRLTGWKEYLLNGDSTLIISADNFHSVNLITGEGWDMDVQLFKKDYGKVVGMAALGIATALLTGVAMVPSGPDYVGPLHSNILMEDSVFYVASKSSLNKFKYEGDTIWTKGDFGDEGSKSLLFHVDDEIVLLNYGFAYRGYNKIPFGHTFIARFDKEGKLLYKSEITSEELISDFRMIEDYIYLLNPKGLIKVSLETGKQEKYKSFRTEAFEGFSGFWKSKMCQVEGDNKITYLPELLVITGNNMVIQMDDQLSFVDQFKFDELMNPLLFENDRSFYNYKNEIYVLNRDLSVMTIINQKVNYDVFGHHAGEYFNAEKNILYRIKL